MKIALFANDYVGIESARIIASKGVVEYLVVDSKELPDVNRAIIQASGIDPEKIIYWDKEATVVQALKNAKLDLILLAWWPYIVTQKIIDCAQRGCLNFHPSLLPYNAGKHTTFWNIVEQVPFGVTIHSIDERIDCGFIAFQKKIPVMWTDTGYTLRMKALRGMVTLFQETIDRIIAGEIPEIVQDFSKRTYHHSRELEAASYFDLDAQYAGKTFLNLVRAKSYSGFLPEWITLMRKQEFPSFQGAWFLDGGSKYEMEVALHECAVLPKIYTLLELDKQYLGHELLVLVKQSMTDVKQALYFMDNNKIYSAFFVMKAIKEVAKEGEVYAANTTQKVCCAHR